MQGDNISNSFLLPRHKAAEYDMADKTADFKSQYRHHRGDK
jgi:hypothetical protein